MWGFFKLITPFIDPLTREKLKFNEDLNKFIPSEQLVDEVGGKLNFEYDHSVYWPALVKLADERRESRKARWIAGGKHIGEFEDYLAGGVDHGVAGPAVEESVGEAKVEDLKLEELKVEEAPAAEAAAEGEKKLEA